MPNADESAEQPPGTTSRLHADEAEAYALLLDRDEEGLRLLQEAVGHSLLALIRRSFSGNGHEFCEDVYAWTLARVWQKVDQYDESQARMLTWMARIARNRAIDLFRATKRAQEAGERRGRLRTSPEFIRYDQVVRPFLDELSPLERAIVIIDLEAFPERISAKLIAERRGDGTTTNSVYSRRSNAYKKLEALTGLPKPGGKR